MYIMSNNLLVLYIFRQENKGYAIVLYRKSSWRHFFASTNDM